MKKRKLRAIRQILPRRKFHLYALFLPIAFWISLPAQTISPPAASQELHIRGPLVSAPVSAFSFDGDLRRLPPIQENRDQQHPRPRSVPNEWVAKPSLQMLTDLIRQNHASSASMPDPIRNFIGMDRINHGSGYPPDPNGDVGPNHYMQAVNTSIAIFNKSGTQLATFHYNAFFSSPIPSGTLCDSYNRGDPVVLYDPLADRWIISDFAWSNTGGPFYECLAVSKTGDPVQGGWWKYAFKAHDTLLNDYPKLAVWPDAYYMSADLFSSSPEVFHGQRIWALDRNAMLSGIPFTSVSFDLPTSSYTTLLPSNLRGTPPPAGSPNYLVMRSNPGKLYLYRFHVDWSNPAAASTLNGPTILNVVGWTDRTALIPQKNSSKGLDPLGDRLMMQNQYRNSNGVESLWLNHTVDSGGIAGIRWYQILDPNGTVTVRQQGTYQPDTSHRWMGSLAVDKDGNMALGFSVSSDSMFPSIRYAGRLATDPLGLLSQGEVSLIEGTGPQNFYERWGDYSAMTVDPVDDCTFWYTNEYYAADSDTSWKTRVGAFKFPSCIPVPRPSKILHFPVVFQGSNASRPPSSK